MILIFISFQVPSCVTSKKGNIGIEQDDIDECYEEGRGSLYSVMRHVAINVFRIENLLYFSYGGTRSTRRQKATMALPKELKNEFLGKSFLIKNLQLIE